MATQQAKPATQSRSWSWPALRPRSPRAPALLASAAAIVAAVGWRRKNGASGSSTTSVTMAMPKCVARQPWLAMPQVMTCGQNTPAR